MKRRTLRKLTINRETLCHLEEQGLKNAAGGATTKVESICFCETHICITLQYSNCNTCLCA
ncbi:MAG TPA: class I lanthipeptide [Thermoanaerobaculia bacterium]|nr:class I lanthipeptide [Thermoanaerobaculia bacterium]